MAIVASEQKAQVQHDQVKTVAAAAAAAAAPAAAVRHYCPQQDHAAVVDICRNVYGGTDDLPQRINDDAAQQGCHILVAATGGPAAELDAVLCCQQRGDVLWLYGARTRELKRGNGLAQRLLEEAEALAGALPGVAALLSVTVPANTTMRRLFAARRGFRQQCCIQSWPATEVALAAHEQLQAGEQQAQQARQQQAQHGKSRCREGVHAAQTAGLLSLLPAAAAVVVTPAARQLLPHWRRCQSQADLQEALLLLRQLRTSRARAGAAGGEVGAAVAVGTEEEDTAAAVVCALAGEGQVQWPAEELSLAGELPLGVTSNAFLWLPAEYELVPAGAARVDQLLRQGQVWLLQPPPPAAASSLPSQPQQTQQQTRQQHQQQQPDPARQQRGQSWQAEQQRQQQQQQQQEAPAELACAVLVLYGPGFRGMRHAGIVAGSRAALESALLHAAGSADPHCCRFYVDCCDRFEHPELWGSTGGERFDILPFYKPLGLPRMEPA